MEQFKNLNFNKDDENSESFGKESSFKNLFDDLSQDDYDIGTFLKKANIKLNDFKVEMLYCR